MRRFAGLRRIFRPDHGRPSLPDEVDAELAFHIDSRVDELVARGTSSHAARATAVREFGDWDRIRDDCVSIDAKRQREIRVIELLESVVADVRYGWRGLRRAPGFTVVAVLTLALGIGATTAIFSVVSSVLLRPLPYYQPDRIVHLGERDAAQTGRGGTTSLENFNDWRRLSRSFESIGLYSGWSPTLTGRGDPERISVARVTSGIFDVFRVAPVLGRPIERADNVVGAAPVVLIGYDLWRARFGGDPNIVGRTITLNLAPVTVIGILPPAFNGPDQLARPVWANFIADTSDGRSGRSKNVVARVRAGVSLEQAQAEMSAIAGRLAQAYPSDDRGRTVVVDPLAELTLGDVRRPLYLLLGAAGLVLLIACANLSNLLLARGTARGREFAIRAALGAASSRSVRQLLTESLVLSALGGSAGLILAHVATDMLVGLGPSVLRDRASGIDLRVVAFAAAVSILTGAVFGLVPAVRVARGNAHAALKEAGTRVSSRRGGRTRTTLSVAQLALALVLLAASGLVLKSFARVLRVDPGIRTDHLLAVTVTLPGLRYDSTRSTSFYEQLEARLVTAPGVRGVAMTSLVPLSGDFDRIGIVKVDGEPDRIGADQPQADRYVVSASYFSTLSVRLLRGRLLTRYDRFTMPVVCVVDEVFARRTFGSGDPIGRRMKIPGRDSLATIVGVVSHVKTYGLDAGSPGQIYMTNAQFPWRWMQIVVRTVGDPLAFAPTLIRAVHALDPDQPVYGLTTMDRQMVDLLRGRRFTMTLLVVFAVVAILMAAVGLYGVVAFGVNTRRREIGVRIALGAQHRQIAAGVVREGARLALAGVVLGAVGALAAGRILAGLLFDVSARDPFVLATVAAVLVAVALAASWVPARRAMRVDASEVLRGE